VKKVEGKKDMVVYVKLDEYNDIKDIVSLMKAKLKQARYLLNNVAELKKREDSQIESLSSEINHVEERVDNVDKSLKEPEI
jgi:uncharacterized protein Yka (UPF0111/DUF47 family)